MMAVFAVIRLKGRFSMHPDVETTLFSLTLTRLYSCTLIHESDSSKGMLQACKDVVSFGPVEKDTVQLLLAKRGHSLDGKKLTGEQSSKAAAEFLSGKKLSDIGVSPVFCLTPPKGGFGTRKAHVPKGPIGKNPQIAELISRMV